MSRIALHVAASFIALMHGTGTFAQNMATDGPEDEIIVTAQKRAENLQDVPIAISAFSGEAIKELGFQSTTDVVSQIPNVAYLAPFGDGGAPVFNIRGVSTIDFGDSNEPSVSFYSDEVYIGTPAGQGLQMFDVERVEVLRGPQGTLYGRNATGGLIHFISSKPTDRFFASIEGQYGSYDQRIVEGVVNGPITSGLRARLAAKYNEDRGWQRNLVNDSRFNKMDSIAVRGMIEADLGANGEALLNLHYSKMDGTYTGYGFFGTVDPLTGAPCAPDRVLASECVNTSGFRDPDPDPRRIYSSGGSLPNKADVAGGSLRLNWDFGGAELTSISAFEHIKRFVTEDAAGAAVTPFPLFATYTTNNKQYSQELRLAGDRDQFTWVVGAYYYHDSRFVTNDVPSFDFSVFADLHTDTWAVFGQATLDLTDTLSLSLGTRYTQEDRTLERLASVSGGTANTREGTPFFEASGKIGIERTTGRFALDWKPSQDMLVYASIGTGFKSGGFNTILVASQDEVGPVDEEEITAYEIGLKSKFWDRRATLNLAAFFYDYQGIQAVGSSAGTGGLPTARFINAGDANVYGAEAELSVVPTDNLRINLGAGVLDTKIKADPSSTFNGQPLNGNRLLQAPTFNMNGLIRYAIPTAHAGEFAVQSDFQYQTRVFFGPDNQPTESEDSYGLVNVRLSWASPDERFSAQAFGENIFDKEYFLYSADISPINNSLVATWGRPRTYGIRLTAKFQ